MREAIPTATNIRITISKLALVSSGLALFVGPASRAAGFPEPVPSIRVTWEEMPTLVAGRNAPARSEREAAEARLGHLARSFLPRFEAHGGLERYQSNWIGSKTAPYAHLEARTTLIEGGRAWLEDRARREDARAASEAVSRGLRERALSARELYWSIVHDRQAIGVLDEAGEMNARNRQAADRRVARGLGTPTDPMEFDLYSGWLAARKLAFQASIEGATARLRAEVSAPGDVELADRSLPAIPRAAEAVEAELAGSEPGREALLARAGATERRARALARTLVPSLDLVAQAELANAHSHGNQAAAGGNAYSVGLEVEWRFFDGLASAREAAAERARARSWEEEAAIRETDTGVEKAEAILRLRFAREREAELGRLQEGAAAYLAGTLSEYDRGLKNSPDVLGASQRNTETQLERLALAKEYQLAKARLLALLGR